MRPAATPAARLVVPLVAAVLVAGCGGPGDGGSPPVAASAEPTSSPTAEPTQSPTGAASPDPTDAPSSPEDPDSSPSIAAADAPCTAADSRLEPTVTDQASRVQEATADLDGDGADDRVVTYAIEGEDSAVFMLRVITAAEYVVEASLDQASPSAPVEPLGAATIGVDRDVVLVAEGAGASALLVSVWGFAEFDGAPCALVRLPTGDRSELIAVGGSMAAAGGLACRDVTDDGRSELVVTTAERTADDQWQWHEQAWSWTGSPELEPVAEHTGVVETQEELAPRLGLDCPGVQSGGDGS